MPADTGKIDRSTDSFPRGFHASRSSGNRSSRTLTSLAHPAVRRPNPNLSPSPPRRPGRRLPRHQSSRPLPLARRHRLRRNPRLGRSRKQANLRLPRADPLPPGDSRPPHQALELRALHHSQPARRPLLFPSQHRTSTTERPPSRRISERRTARLARSQHSLHRWHRRISRYSYLRRRQVNGLRPRHLRLRLERVARPRRRHRQRSLRRSQMGKVLRRILDQRQPGFLLQPLRRTQRRGHARHQLFPEALLSPPGHRAIRGQINLRTS